MANPKHLAKLSEGVDAWNKWVKLGSERADLRDADLSGLNLMRYDFTDAHLRGANLQLANLQRAKLNNAYLRRADLTGANLTSASLRAANFRHAVLRDAKLKNAYLRRVDLSYVDLRGADLSGAVLEYARFVDVNLDQATLKGCFIYGASVWNMIGTPKVQSDLVITPSRDSKRNDPIITVNDLEVAQFIYLLLNHKKLRGAINSVTEKGVLLLGRFSEGGLSVLQAMAAKLSKEGYLPIIFDFARPQDRYYTETIQTLAGLSRFVIVDLSGPSVPHELQTVVPNIKIPYIPVIERGKKPFATFPDLLAYPWVLRPIVTFAGTDELLEMLRDKVITPAEELYMGRKKQLQEIFGPAANA